MKYELSGAITGMAQDFRGRRVTLILSLNEDVEAKHMFDELNEVEKLSIKIDKYREKRSLNANNYAWALITEVANIVRSSKDEVYLEMLKRYGQSEIVSVLAHIPLKEYVKYCEEAGESMLNGKLFKHYKVYKGSSEFDTREMSIFIDGIVSEADGLGIQTMTPGEIARLKAMWRE